jgi:hypothetical protein
MPESNLTVSVEVPAIIFVGDRLQNLVPATGVAGIMGTD